jgi:hypothetical protein
MPNMGRRCEFQGALAPALRGVHGVLVIVGEYRTRAEVYGIGHRHPVTVPVSLGLAARLAEAGAPVTVQVGRSAGRAAVSS